MNGDAPARTIDRVVVLDERGRESRTLRFEEFAKLALHERVKLILGKRLRFFADGAEVPLKEALVER